MTGLYSRVVPLVLLLLLLVPSASSARADGGGGAVAGAGGLVDAAGGARRAAGRTFGVYATIGADGRPRGTVSFADRDGTIRLRAETIEQLTLGDGVATLVGSARVGEEGGYRFRLVLRPRRGDAPHHLTIDVSGPSLPAYRADGDLASGSLRIIASAPAPRAPTATPTRTFPLAAAASPTGPTATSAAAPIRLAAVSSPTGTPTPTRTATAAATPTPTRTPTAAATLTPTGTPTRTATATRSATPTGTATATSSATPTATATSSATPTASATGTATPTPPGIAYLNGATTTVGAQTYLTTNGGAPSGSGHTQQNLLNVVGPQNLVDSNLRSIFVSTPVPAGQLWDISGNWRFSAWTRASAADAGGFVRATIYRLDAAGAPSLVAISPDALTNGFASTDYVRSLWDADVPSGTILQPGERWAVEFQVDVSDVSASLGFGAMELGATAHDSYVLPALVALAPSATPTASATLTPGGPATSTPTRTGTPVPGYYLHAATTAVGSQIYQSVSTSGPTGTLTTLTADLTAAGVQNFQDSATGRSIFVSSAVPAGTSWDLGGDWSLTAYTRATFNGASGYVQASLYRVDAAGNAYLLATSLPDSANAIYSTNWVPASWTLTVPGGTTIGAGERWGIQLQIDITSSVVFGQAQLGLDTLAQGSRLQPAVLARAWTATPTATRTGTPTATVTPGGPTMTRTPTATATATAIPAYNLHAATTTVGGKGFRSISTAAPANPGAVPTMTASIGAVGVDGYQDPVTGQSIFVSGANPSASASWDLGGTWSFSVYTSASTTGATGYLRATIDRVDAAGSVTPLLTTGQAATNALLGTGYSAQSWTFDVPSETLIGPGERWGVEFELDTVANRFNATSALAYDTTALQSRVRPVVNTVAFTPTATSTPTATGTPGPGTPSATATNTPAWTRTATATACAYACDNFNRGTQPSLGSATSGGAWQLRQRDAGSIGLCGSAACAASATGDGAYAALSTGLVDHTAQVAIKQPAAGSATAGLVVRARSDWSRFVLAELTHGGQIILWRYDGGWTALGQSVVALGGGQTDLLSAVGSGSTIAVRWNGVDQFSVQDTADAGGTYAGIYFGTYAAGGARPTLDDFGVAPTGAAPPAPVSAVAPGACGTGTGASDFFNRTPPTGSLGCANGSGPAWTAPVDSAWTICATARACALAPAGAESWVALNANLTSQRVTAQLQPRSTTAQGMAGIAARMSGFDTNLLWAGLDANGQVDVWILADGAWTQATGAPIGTTYKANVSRKLEIGVSGSFMSVYVDNSRVFGPYDVGPAPAGATQAALYAQTTDDLAVNWPQFDSFAVTAGP